MKSITYAEKTLLLGDDAASAILDYAVLLARTGSADSIVLNALTPEGRPEVVTMLIGPATMMTAASSDLTDEEPNNVEAIAVVRERMRIISSPPKAMPATDATGDLPWEDLA